MLMKHTNQKFKRSKTTSKLLLAAICVVLISIFMLTFAACSKNNNSNTNGDTDITPTIPDTTPSTTPDDSGTTQRNPLEDFASALSNVDGLNATTTITISFGGKMLNQKTIEYTRTETGGNVKTTLTTLNTADAQNPYGTQETTSSFDAEEFANKFPKFVGVLDENIMQEWALATDNQSLTFTIAKTNAVVLLNLSETDAANVASNISVLMEISSEKPSLVRLTYATSNGNTVEIKTEYSAA